MKMSLVVIFLLSFNFLNAQKLDSILIETFIKSIEIDNNQILEIQHQNNNTIHFLYSKDSSFVIITQGDCMSLDLKNLKKPCNRISIFVSQGNLFFNVFGFKNTDMNYLLDYINATDQEFLFKSSLSTIFNIDFFEMEEIFETWEKFSVKRNKYEKKLDKRFKISDPNPYSGNKIW